MTDVQKPANRKTIKDLLNIMAALRDPKTGCEWDIAQSYDSIVPYTIEEAYEVAEAIENKDFLELRDELGDLLFQTVFYAQIASEEQRFDFDDVIEAICDKMIRRHPHVFGTAEERAQGMVKGQWEQIKATERVQKAAERQQTKSHNSHGGTIKHQEQISQAAQNSEISTSIPLDPPLSPITNSILADIPRALPALRRAVKLQNRAARVGFDWPSLKPVFDKMREELAELEVEINHEDRQNNKEAIAAEFGDLMFVMANVARHLDIDPEAALTLTNQKFINRFTRIEQLLADQGKTPEQSDLEEMDRLWDQAKAEERSKMS